MSNHSPVYLLTRWLELLKINVSPDYLKQQLLSHPDYPSLLSITDVLDELGIDNAALVAEKEKLHEMPVPFLVHTHKKGGEFILIRNTNGFLKDNPDFEKQWDGIAVIAEKPEYFENIENEKMFQQEKRNRRILWFAMLLITGLSFYSTGTHFSWQYISLLITTITGLSVGVLIIQHELGISNEFTEQLCGAGRNTDCDAVMKSKGVKLLQWFNWADAGIIYFSSVFIILIFAFFAGTIQSFATILSLLAASSLPFTIFSVYYQWRVVKKWCPLCIATVSILWAQFLLLMPALSITSVPVPTILFTAFVFIVIAATWVQLLKPSLQKNKELTDKNFSLLRFKNNPEIFNALLRNQRRVDIIPIDNDLQLGKPDADLQIMVACNPYCSPCAKAHKELDELLGQDNIGLTVRFAIKTEKKDDKRLQAVQYILQLAKDKSTIYKRRILHDWYIDMNFEKFSKNHFLNNDESVEELLKQHERWSDESNITYTPTIFINGHELSRQYRAGDLKAMFRNNRKSENINQEKYIDENDLIPV